MIIKFIQLNEAGSYESFVDWRINVNFKIVTQHSKSSRDSSRDISSTESTDVTFNDICIQLDDSMMQLNL